MPDPECSRAAVESFYTLRAGLPPGAVCRGTACFVARHRQPGFWPENRPPGIHCLGHCFDAPAHAGDGSRPGIWIHSHHGPVLGHVAIGGARCLAEYQALGGYRALQMALGGSAEAVLDAIDASGLRGRGGAGFPTGRKWHAFADAVRSAGVGHIVANGDEGDPGAFVDRFLMEDDPFAVIEGLTLASLATGARHGHLYVRAEYPAAARNLSSALEEARASGLLGPHILGSTLDFDIQLNHGRGSYVCGEETALIRSLEHRRPEVQSRPPHPTQHGFLGRPTLVNNVETLANVPWIVRHGAAAFHALGIGSSRGTKVLSLNSLFRHPGLHEVEFGTSLREIVEHHGGGLADGSPIQGILVGGPLAGVVFPKDFDTPLGFEELARIGAGVGHGGVIAFDGRTSPHELAREVSRFAAEESCGKCTPCRLGAPRLERLHAQNAAGTSQEDQSNGEIQALTEALIRTSLCGLGRGLGQFSRSLLNPPADGRPACR
jgi:NADH:ubiquinone oxidoreductase subunit F (NADH-binding)